MERNFEKSKSESSGDYQGKLGGCEQVSEERETERSSAFLYIRSQS